MPRFGVQHPDRCLGRDGESISGDIGPDYGQMLILLKRMTTASWSLLLGLGNPIYMLYRFGGCQIPGSQWVNSLYPVFNLRRTPLF